MDLNKLFHPRAVALIGASTESNKLSGRPLRFFREYGYAGRIYPVNPKYQEIDGLRCFAKLSDIPSAVDLAVITLPASVVPDALAKCGANYMNSQLIKMEALADGYAEGIALDVNGYVSEGSGENIFALVNGNLLTPPLGASVLPGITRDSIIAIAQDLGLPVRFITTGETIDDLAEFDPDGCPPSSAGLFGLPCPAAPSR